MLIKRPKTRQKPPDTVLEERRERFQEVRRVGRPPGARNRLSEQFIGDLQDLWADHGPSILQRMLLNEPTKLAELVARLIPREFQVSVEHTGGRIPPEDQALLVELLRTIKNAVPANAPTTPVLEFISEALRAEYAKQIETE